MITINLRPGARRAPSGAPFAGLGESLKRLAAKVKDPALAAAAGISAVVLAGMLWGFIGTGVKMSRLQPAMDEARAENQQFRTLLAQIRREERIRDSVVTELQTLRQVDRDRYVWPHILEEVSRALPPATWLVSVVPVGEAASGFGVDDEGNVVQPSLSFEITGRAMDIQGFTRFMRQLEDSPWLYNTTAISAETIIDQNRAVTQFVVRAGFQQADSVYVRLVPVAEAAVVGTGRLP
jgi:Tfp pilus assembly protein PilN